MAGPRLFRRLKKELTGVKLLFNFLFWGGHFGIFALGWYLQETSPRLVGLNSLTFSVWMSRAAGMILSVDGALLLLPMCRNLVRWIRPKIKFLPLDENIWFHKQVAYALLLFTAIHVLAHYVNFFNVERTQIRPEAAVQIHYTEAGGITGHVMLLCMFLIYTTAHAKIRQQSFETFWYTHHLFIPFFLALYTHAQGCFVRDSTQPYSPFDFDDFWGHCIGYQGWRWQLPVGVIYLAERLWREVRSRKYTEVHMVVRHPYEAIELQFIKPSMKYKAGQWLFINIPAVSRGQWHPFTITSCPFDPYISIHMRQVGDWTRAAADALGAGRTQMEELAQVENIDFDKQVFQVALAAGQEMPEIRIDGPYGAPAEDVFNNEVAILIGTGIGVTPWASILKNIWHLRSGRNPPTRLKRVEFIWVCRDTSSFEWFKELLTSLEDQSIAAAAEAVPGYDSDSLNTERHEFLRIHTYLTQKMTQDMAENIMLNTYAGSKDPLTELRSRTNFGRPDFKRLFEGIRGGILDGTYVAGVGGPQMMDQGRRGEVGVYFCGPNMAAKSIKKACGEVNRMGKGVQFKFWKEHF